MKSAIVIVPQIWDGTSAINGDVSNVLNLTVGSRRVIWSFHVNTIGVPCFSFGALIS